MFNLFNKGPKVKAGKQNNQEEKKKSAVTLTGGKGSSQQNVLAEAWKKVQKMDRKQAYTLGAVAVVALVALLSIASMGGQDAEDFAEFETRGYDLANMPFSTDEAEQYLLASKYPDMNDKGHAGLYSKAEKEDRQAEDAAAKEQAQQELGASSKASEYRPNRYYGGGGSGKAASPTQVGTLNSSNLKSAGGSGMKSTFGPQGDFSNFRNQNRGNDKFVPKGPGSGDARKALLQTAQASRAAAGLKNDKLLNAKKAMMGGNVQGSGAFLDDSGAVNLGELKGLELDTNAPISSGDLSGLDDAVKDANQKGTEEAQEEEEMEWWEQWLIDIGQQIVSGLINWGMNAAQDAAQVAKASRIAEQDKMSELVEAVGTQQQAAYQAEANANNILETNVDGWTSDERGGKTFTSTTDEGVTTTRHLAKNTKGEIIQTVTIRQPNAKPVTATTNLTQNSINSAKQYAPLSKKPTEGEVGTFITSGGSSDRIQYNAETGVVTNAKGQRVGTYNKQTREFTYDTGMSGKDLRTGETLAEINKYNRDKNNDFREANINEIKSAGRAVKMQMTNNQNYRGNTPSVVEELLRSEDSGDFKPIRGTEDGFFEVWNGKEWVIVE